MNNFRSLLAIEPVIFPISSKLALKAKTETTSMLLNCWNFVANNKTDPEDLKNNVNWQTSHFGDLEKYILESLDSGQRAKLKMVNPIGVADHIVTQYVASIDVQMEVVKEGIFLVSHLINILIWSN